MAWVPVKLPSIKTLLNGLIDYLNEMPDLKVDGCHRHDVTVKLVDTTDPLSGLPQKAASLQTDFDAGDCRMTSGTLTLNTDGAVSFDGQCKTIHHINITASDEWHMNAVLLDAKGAVLGSSGRQDGPGMTQWNAPLPFSFHFRITPAQYQAAVFVRFLNCC